MWRRGMAREAAHRLAGGSAFAGWARPGSGVHRQTLWVACQSPLALPHACQRVVARGVACGRWNGEPRVFHVPRRHVATSSACDGADSNRNSASTGAGDSTDNDRVGSAGSAAGEGAVGGKEGKETYKQKLRKFVKAYGMPGVAVYTVVSVGDLALLYAAAKAGLDLSSLVKVLPIHSICGTSGQAASEALGPMVVAYVQGCARAIAAPCDAAVLCVAVCVSRYAAHKLLMPARFALTFAITPKIVNNLRAKGLLSTPAPPQPESTESTHEDATATQQDDSEKPASHKGQ